MAAGTRVGSESIGIVLELSQGSLSGQYAIWAAAAPLPADCPWLDYGFGESVYLVLSLAAKSARAWRIVAGSVA